MKERNKAIFGSTLIVISVLLWVFTGATIPSYDFNIFDNGKELNSEIKSNHTEALLEQQSYKTKVSVTNRGYTINNTYRVNKSSGNTIQRQDNNGNITQWYSNGEQIIHSNNNNSQSDTKTNINQTDTTGAQNILIENITYVRDGIITKNGTQLVKYTGTSVKNPSIFSSAFRAPVPPSASVTEFSSELLVNPNSGIIKSHTWNVELGLGGREVSLSGKVTVTNINGEIVRTPDWATP